MNKIIEIPTFSKSAAELTVNLYDGLEMTLKIGEEAVIEAGRTEIETLSESAEISPVSPVSSGQDVRYRAEQSDGCATFTARSKGVEHERRIKASMVGRRCEIAMVDALTAERDCAFILRFKVGPLWEVGNIEETSGETLVRLFNEQSQRIITLSFSTFSTIEISADRRTLHTGRVMLPGLTYVLSTVMHIGENI